jgi:ATP-dependent DNA ligase
MTSWRPDGQDVRPEPLEARRKRLARLLKAKVVREGVQLSEALAGDGAVIFRHACMMGLEGIVSKHGLPKLEDFPKEFGGSGEVIAE